MKRRYSWIALGGLAALASIGCAQEREPINRVQPNALSKSFFVGQNLQDPADDPEFYKRDTVVDVGFGAAQDGLFTSTYAQPISRIRWEITEDTLNARLSYERVQNSDGKGNQVDGLVKKATNDGQIVASFKITSHFDVRRDYNPQTGEELNVTVENSSDRAWYEREYMRVDWSKNLVTDAYDFDTLSMMGIYGSIDWEPMAYTVLDPASPDAPQFDVGGGYFDVTNKAYATPKLIDLSSLGWGIDKFPACMLPGEFSGGTQPYGNCNPTEVTIRSSYKRVVDNDYEPVDVDGYRFQAAGIFTTERTGYERNYGMIDDRWFRFADRYNLWQRSHYYADPEAMTGAIACATKETTEVPTGNPAADPNRDLTGGTDANGNPAGNGTADECEAAGPGSRCDIFNHKCTLPYAERAPRTITWYIGGDTNENLFEATNWATQEWDLALKTAIQVARLAECRRTHGDSCESRFPMWTGQEDDNEEAIAISRDFDACLRQKGWDATECRQAARDAAARLATERNDQTGSTAAIGEVVAMDPMLVLCHNPVIASDHPACGAEGLAPRLGDIRYNSVLNIEKPQQPSAWGIMVDADDPVTGEKVAASINIWSHVTDIATQGLVDLVRYINGDLTTAEITEGKYIHDWAMASQLGSSGAMPTLSRAEANDRVAAVAGVDAKALGKIEATAMPQPIRQVIAQAQTAIGDVAARSDIPSPAMAMVQATMKQARNTPTEAVLMNPAMMQLAGVSGNLPMQGAVADAVSPFAMGHPKVRAELRRMREMGLAARGACILDEAPEASALTGLADILARKFPKAEGESASQTASRYQRMFQYIQRRYQYAVIAHEMGHSIGLRHNFVSSSASLFYRPQYWQLRTKNGKVTKECTDSVADGSTCVGPRYFDPITDEEQSQLIWMFMQSTVMDYPGDVSQDTIGLGAYDFAAARMFYGDTVAVHADADMKAGSKIGTGITLATDTFGGLAGIQYGVRSGQGADNFHYSQLQKNYKVLDANSCHDVSPQAPAWWREDVDGVWDPVLDGHVVSIDGKYTKCAQRKVDYVGWTDLRMPSASEISGGFYRGGVSVDAQGRTRVPYAFATDHWADTGNISVFRHDNGADPYEQMMFLITTQENRHILDNYRRNRTTFDVRAAADRSFSRYNEKVLGIGSSLAFMSSIYRNFGTSQGYQFDTLWPYIVDSQYYTNALASSVALDHFARELARPEAGDHYLRDAAFHDPVYRSASDSDGNPGTTTLTIPNGTTGYLRDVGIGGHPLENALSDNHGDYDSTFTINAGSYYDKIHTAILLADSEDRFISQSRQDFYDARFRAVGMADILPDGFRRIVANALTGDRSILAPMAAADASGKPLTQQTTDPRDPNNAEGSKLWPAQPLGWKTWGAASGPSVCFPKDGSLTCQGPEGTTAHDFGGRVVDKAVPVDPQVGWEVQKFLVAWTMAHIKANQKADWLDMMRIYRLGQNSDPQVEQRVEFQDPISGEVFYARSYGRECLFGSVGNATTDDAKRAACESSGGKWVEKGIAARVLQYAGELASKAYLADSAYAATNGFDAHGRFHFVSQPDGTPVVVADPAVKGIAITGNLVNNTTCNQNDDPSCTALPVWANHWAVELKDYKSVPDYLWECGIRYGFFGDPNSLGLF